MQDLTIVFDLDGTLVETAPDLIHATNHALTLRGLGPVASAELRPFISLGARAMIRKGLEVHGHHVPETEFEPLFASFIAHYADNIAVASHAFPGLEECLERLARRGARLAVCTNKLEALSRKLLDAVGLSGRFAALAGRDTFPVCKPHPEHLLGVIQLAGGDPRRAIMIGDSDVDVATAKAAGIPIVAVTFGYTEVPVHSLSPDAVIDDYGALEAAIDQIELRPDRNGSGSAPH
jgi:phosphoglycolate phosphatase